MPLSAQNSVDILNGGPQPANTAGCAMNAQCIPATWSTTSNAGSDISAPITANFVFDSAGGALPTDFPPATAGNICLADTRDLTGTTLFAQIAANCQAARGVALLLIRNSAVTAPSAIPVFVVSTSNGDFLRNTVGFNSSTGVSNFPIRINVAKPTPPANPTGQHNCPLGQAVPAYDGTGTANYEPNESLCLPAGAGQAVEPSLTVDSQGTVYVESIRGVPGGLDLWRYFATTDGAPNADGTLPFKYEGQPDCGMFVTPFCQESGLAPGGGDGDITTNSPDPTNSRIPNLAVVSLTAAEVTGSNSTNRGDSFSTPNPATAGVPFDDRMWINAVDDPNHVWMEYHDFGTTSQIFVQRSDDGGFTYSGALGEAVDANTEPSAGPPSGNIAGQIKVDNTSCTSHGNLYQIFVAPDNPMDNLNNSSAFNNAVYVGVSPNASLSAPALTFTDYKVFSCGAGSTCPGGVGLGNLFPALAVDKLGYVYATWSDNTNIYYSFSTNQGQRWSPAIIVTQGTPQAGKSNVFPWIAADANGHVAIAWYGADASGNSNTVPASTTHWNVFVAETVNGHAVTPAFTFSQATDHSNHTGQISTGGLTGASDRSLADFFQIGFDPNHLVNIAYADNHAGTSVSYFTRERTPMSGIVTTGACAGTCREAGGKGHINGKKTGKASFSFNHDGCNQTDSASFIDSGSAVNFQATSVASATFNDVAHTVTLVGNGTDNGAPVTFTIVAADSSLAPPGLFNITLSDGYSNSGALLDGSISIY
jgi:hypothetical protein